MLKKVILISLIPSIFIFAEDNFDVSDVQVIDLSKKEKPEKNKDDIIDFLDKKSKELSDKNVDITIESPETVIEVSDDSELGKSLDLDTGEEIVPTTEIVPIKPTFTPKIYKNIHYTKKYMWFSLLNGKEKYVFDQALNELKIKGSFDIIKNDISTPRNVIANALYYDLIEKRPDIAENFYLIMYKNRNHPEKFGFKWSNIILTDYLLRTGRLKPAKKLIRPMDCIVHNKTKDKCYYYYGAVNYLTTGNNRNIGIREAKKTIKKAKIIYNAKTKKKKHW